MKTIFFLKFIWLKNKTINFVTLAERLDEIKQEGEKVTDVCDT
jgi:hypothetical protein